MLLVPGVLASKLSDRLSVPVLSFFLAVWLAEIVMFLVLGALVVPSHLVEVAGPGLLMAIVLMRWRAGRAWRRHFRAGPKGR